MTEPLYTFGEIAQCPKLGSACLVEIVGTEPGDYGTLYHVWRVGHSHSPFTATVIVAEGELRKLTEEP
uniref:Uncharacterized protein n=1 Tax=viral metagenome TaxID=1070528 RepID=A0A6M3L6W8_9ZZZZ